MSYNIMNALQDAIKGQLAMAKPGTIQERRSICDGCEARDKVTDCCTACGCFIPAKMRLAKSSCPMELWTKE